MGLKMDNRIKSIITSITFIFFALCLGGILLFAYAIGDLNLLIGAVLGIPMLICIIVAVYILKKPNSVDKGYAHYLKTEPDKINNSREKARCRHQKRHTDFCIKDLDIKSIITDPLFALDGKKLYKKIIASAAAMGIAEDELTADIRRGEVFKCIYSIICIGNKYTLYCDAVQGIHFLFFNDSIMKVSTVITEDTEYKINYFFIALEYKNNIYKMRCEDYMENEILRYYLTISRNLHHDCEIADFNY